MFNQRKITCLKTSIHQKFQRLCAKKLPFWRPLFFLAALLTPGFAFAHSANYPATLVLGVRGDAPPFSSCEGDNPDSCEGYSVALCKRIAERAQKEGVVCDAELKIVSASNRFTALFNGEIDMLCGASTVTLERMRGMDFTLFTFLSGISVMYDVSPAPAIEGSYKPFKIGFLENTTTKDLVGEIWQQIKADLGAKNKGFETTEFKNHYDGLAALAMGKIKAYIADREILMALRDSLGRTGVNLKISMNYFSLEPYALGITLGNSEMRFIANSVLSELFAGSKYGEQQMGIIKELKKYFPGSNFSNTMIDMYSQQRLNPGSQIVPSFQKLNCSK